MVTLIRVLGRTKAMPPIDDLAAECGVTKRTVYRDLLALEAARWPLPRREA
jgi:predicted DNA-binding transcriptional regulator YafY